MPTIPPNWTSTVADAVDQLVDAGIPVLNQSVLLRGVNDSVDTLVAIEPAAGRYAGDALLPAPTRPGGGCGPFSCAGGNRSAADRPNAQRNCPAMRYPVTCASSRGSPTRRRWREPLAGAYVAWGSFPGPGWPDPLAGTPQGVVNGGREIPQFHTSGLVQGNTQDWTGKLCRFSRSSRPTTGQEKPISPLGGLG